MQSAVWTLPATSLVVHRLKLPEQFDDLADWLSSLPCRRCTPPFVFTWQPMRHTLHNTDIEGWGRYMQLAARSTFGLHWLPLNASRARQKQEQVERFCADAMLAAADEGESFGCA